MKIRGALLAAILGLLLLLLLLGAVGGAGNAWDVAIVEALGRLRHADPGLTEVAILLTGIGSVYSTVGLPIAAAIGLAAAGLRQRAALLIATVLVERLTVDVIKALINRPRPAFDLHPVSAASASFPSGHAANSMTAFVAIAMFVAPPRFRRPAIAFAGAAAVAIALTRPFLGVHWPSDTLGGWAVSAMFLLAARQFATRQGLLAQEKHQIVARHRPALDQD